MPFLDQGGFILGANSGQTPAVGEVTEQPMVDPGWALGPQIRQQNIIGSFLNRKTLGVDNTVEPGFDLWSEIKGTKYENYIDRIAVANNKNYLDALKKQLDMEELDRAYIDRAGWRGVLSGFVAGTIDPTILLPGGAAVRGLSGAWSKGRSAFVIGSSVAGGAAVQELILHATQELNTPQESAFAIGGSFILGGLLGARAASTLNKAERNAAIAAHAEISRMVRANQEPVVKGGAGADVPDLRYEWEKGARADAEVPGVAGWVRKWLPISPVDRLQQSPSHIARTVNAMLFDDALANAAAVEGRTLGGITAESVARSQHQSMIARIGEQQAKIFSEMRQAGTNMSYSDFDKAVGRALINGDYHGNPYVTRAAQMYRSDLYDPLLARMKEAGFEIKEIEKDASYFPIIRDIEKITAQEPEYRKIITPYFDALIKETHAKDFKRLNTRQARLQAKIDVLSLSREERDKRLAEIEKRMTEIHGSPEGKKILEMRGEARALQAYSAKVRKADEGKLSKVGVSWQVGANEVQLRTAADYTARAKQLHRDMREQFGDLLAEERKLRIYRRDLTRRSVVSKEDEVAKLENKLSDLHENAEKLMERSTSAIEGALEKLRKFEQRVAPETMQEMLQGFSAQMDQIEKSLWNSINRERKADAIAAQKKMAIEQEEGKPTTREGVDRIVKNEKEIKSLQRDKDKELARQERLHQRMAEVREKIYEIDTFDPTVARAELQQLLRDVITEKTSAMLARGEYGKKLLDKIAKEDPELVKQRIKELGDRLHTSDIGFGEKWGSRAVPVDFARLTREAVDHHMNLILGREIPTDEPLSEFMTSMVRGPLRERTAPYPHRAIQDFTHHDASMVGQRYSKVVNAEVAIREKLGTMPNMKEVFERLEADYARLRDLVDTSSTKEEVFAALGRDQKVFEKWRNLPLDQVKERARTELSDWMKSDARDLRATRDILRGTHRVEENSSLWGRVVNGVNMFQYLRLGGRFGWISSLTDTYRPAMVHGLLPFFDTVMMGKLLNGAAYNASKEEAKLAGLVVEGLTHHRLYSMAEVTDTLKADTALERMLRNGSHVMSKFNGLNFMQNVGESASAVLNQNKMLTEIAAGKLTKYLAQLGIGEKEIERFQRHLQHVENLEGIKVSNTERWTNEKDVRDFRAALNRAVGLEIIKPGIADKPLFGYTNFGRLFLLFRNFGLAAHQKIMLKGLQDGPGRFVGGLIGMTTIGALVGFLKAWSGGAERFERWKTHLTNNPGTIIGDALDNSGVLPLVFEMANSVEKFTQGGGLTLNPVKTPIQAIFGGRPQESDQNFNRSVVEALFGPAAGLPSDLARALGATTGITGDLRLAQKRAISGILPFSNALLVKEILQVLHGDSPYMRQ